MKIKKTNKNFLYGIGIIALLLNAPVLACSSCGGGGCGGGGGNFVSLCPSCLGTCSTCSYYGTCDDCAYNSRPPVINYGYSVDSCSIDSALYTN